MAYYRTKEEIEKQKNTQIRRTATQNSTIGKKEPAANDQISRTMNTSTTASVGKNVLANEKRIAEREVSSVKNTQLSRTQTNTQISRSSESDTATPFLTRKEQTRARQAERSESKSETQKKSESLFDEPKKTESRSKGLSFPSNHFSTQISGTSTAKKKDQKNAKDTAGTSGSTSGISLFDKPSLFDSGSLNRRASLATTAAQDAIMAKPQLSRTPTLPGAEFGLPSSQVSRTPSEKDLKVQYEAAITAGNNTLSRYQQAQKEFDQKYAGKDYAKYLRGYKEDHEKLTDLRYLYEAQKAFVEENYGKVTTNGETKLFSTAEDRNWIQEELKKVTREKESYEKASKGMPDLNKLAEYYSLMAYWQNTIDSLTHDSVDTNNGSRYTLRDTKNTVNKIIDPSIVKTAVFGASNWQSAKKIGIPEYDFETDNISSNAYRFVKNLQLNSWGDASLGTEINAMRHVLWVASMSSQLGRDIALKASNAHERNANALKNISDPYQVRFSTPEKADQAIDLLNNQIALELADSLPPESDMKAVCSRVLDEYHRKGFYVMKFNSDGTYSLELHRIADATYRQAYGNLELLNEIGGLSE